MPPQDPNQPIPPDQSAPPSAPSEGEQRNPFKTKPSSQQRSVLDGALTRATTPSPIIPPSSEIAKAALAPMDSTLVSDDPEYTPPPVSQLAQAYTAYETQLYTSGMDLEKVEESLAAWRQQYANGASANEIMYPDYSEFAGPPVQPQAPATSVQPQPLSDLPAPSAQPGTPPSPEAPRQVTPQENDNGELRIR